MNKTFFFFNCILVSALTVFVLTILAYYSWSPAFLIGKASNVMIFIMYAVHQLSMLLLKIFCYLWFLIIWLIFLGVVFFALILLQDFLVFWIYEFIFITIFGKLLSLFTPLKYYFSHLLKFQVALDIFPVVIDVCSLILKMIFSVILIEQFLLSASLTTSFAV